jgi:hypothetical protein
LNVARYKLHPRGGNQNENFTCLSSPERGMECCVVKGGTPFASRALGSRTFGPRLAATSESSTV